MRSFSVIGLIVGAICALIVYAVGVAITSFHNESLVWSLIALLVWGAITFSGRFSDRRL